MAINLDSNKTGASSYPLSTVSLATAQTAYIDFTKKPNGNPPSNLDTGQSVDFIFNAGGRKPVINNGRLVVDNQSGAGTGGLADYYQALVESPIKRVGVEFVMPAGADDGNGNTTYAAWDGVYEGGGTNVPKSWVHMSIIAGTGSTGTAKWFVCNGVGNLFVIKEQTFVNPPADGVTIWSSEAVLDDLSGVAYATLPDGSVMTVKDSDIATMCGILSIPVFKFSDLDSKVAMCEHFCLSGASTAKFAEFKSMWADTVSNESGKLINKATSFFDSLKIASQIYRAIPPLPIPVVNAPTTAISVATTTSAANIDGSGGKVTCLVGPTGKVAVTITAYYEFSANDTLFWRLGGSSNSAVRAACVCVSGGKQVVTQTIVVSGLTVGSSYTGTLQHWTAVAGSATLRCGGSGGGMFPPMTFLAVPC